MTTTLLIDFATVVAVVMLIGVAFHIVECAIDSLTRKRRGLKQFDLYKDDDEMEFRL